MMTETTVTDGVILDEKSIDTKTDADSGLMQDNSGQEEQDTVLPDGEPTPDIEDAGKAKHEEAKYAFKFREEKRRAQALEQEIIALKTKQSATQVEKPAIPKYEAFDTNEDYNVAIAEYQEKLVDYKLAQKENEREIKNTTQSFFDKNKQDIEAYAKKAEVAADKYSDYYQKVESTDFTQAAREAIFKSENSAEIGYYIANNPDVSLKLINMSPVETAFEIRKLDMQIKQKMSQKTVSNAPEPINPVKGINAAVINDANLSASEFIRRRNEKFKK